MSKIIIEKQQQRKTNVYFRKDFMKRLHGNIPIERDPVLINVI